MAGALVLIAAATVPLRAQQAALRKIGEMDLAIRGLTATTDPTLVVPKHVPSGVRVTLRAGTQELSPADAARFLGSGFRLEAELSGPGLPETLTLPDPDDPPSDDPFLLHLPALPTAGNYALANLRLVRDGRTVLDVTPRQVDVQVIDEVLVTSVSTRPLTLDEIKQRGIVLDGDDYLGFEFTLAMKLESTPVNVTFPVVFDRQNIALPELLQPPSVSREGVPLPTFVPVMLEPIIEGDGGPGEKIPLTEEERAQVRIPGVLVIPGNVGYLKQFFSAQLFVANGAPAGARLTVHDVTGTIDLPDGDDLDPNTGDEPLTLAETTTGVHGTLPVRGLGPDGAAGTSDDTTALAPGEQGQAEFLLRGEKEGFHEIDFDIRARLEGLAVGPVTVKGSASGAVLVRNAYYDITFTAPAVVRDGETFSLFATVTNIGQGIGNDINLTLDASRMANLRLVGDGTQRIATLMAGDAATLEYRFVAERTGQVVASYLRFDTADGSTGRLNFTAGIGDRGVPLSPDTLVLPAVVDALPPAVLHAAMRVLGQAWSAATAPAGTLPRGVVRPGKDLVIKKAQALAEAGLRMTLGQPLDGALRDLTFDFYGGGGVGADAGSLQVRLDRGFDQVLRETNAGYALAQALGAALTPAATSAGGALSFEGAVAQVAASGPNFISIAVEAGTATPGGPPAFDLTVTSAAGERSAFGHTSAERPASAVPGLVFLPFGPAPATQALGLFATTAGAPYTVDLVARETTTANLSLTLPRGDGTFLRGLIAGVSVPAQARARVTLDPLHPDTLTLGIDLDGDGVAEAQHAFAVQTLMPQGARLLSANVVGPETLDNAAPFGQHVVLVFDRLVNPEAAANVAAYQVPRNAIVGARSVLSGRLVVLSLEQPEGSYVPTTLALSGMTDMRGVPGPATSVPLGMRLQDDGALVSGRVLQADGTPVRTGHVWYRNNTDLEECRPPGGKLPAIARVALDGEGYFEFRYVRRDSCGFPFEINSIDPSTDALVGTSRYVRHAGEQILVDLVLFGRGSVTGTVRNVTNAPVGDAEVVVLSGTDTQIGGRARTDGHGVYTVHGITVGPVTVRAAKGTSLGYSAGRIDRAGTTAEVNVVMDGGAVRVSGTVFKREGAGTAPLAGAWVGYHVGSSTGSIAGVAQTDALGHYVLEGMPTGSFTLDATSEGYHAYRSGVAVAGDNLSGRDLVIERPGVDNSGLARGTVVLPSGVGAADAFVTVSSSNRGVLTDGDGRFEVPVPVGETVTLHAALRNGTRSGSTTVYLTTVGQIVENVTIPLSGLARAVITVFDADDQEVPNVVVRRLDCNDACGCAAGTTDTNGEVTIDRLKLGTTAFQVVRAVAGGYDVARGQVVLTEDGQTVTGALRFNGHGTVSGVVRDADNGLVHGADIELTSLRFINDGASCGLMSTVSHRTRTEQDGTFRITGVNVGPLEVFASHFVAPRRVGQKGALLGNGREATFELKLVDTMAGELSGTVFLPDGQTPAGAGVEVTVNGVLPDVTVRTNDAGEFRFAKVLPEGSYTLTARDPITGGLAQAGLFLRARQDVRHDVRLKGRGTVRVTVVDAADHLVSSAVVTLTEVDFPRRTYERTLEAAHQGVATFERVFEGPITLQASDLFGRGGRLSTIVPGPDAVVDAKVRLGLTGTVKGRFFIPDATGGTVPVPFGVVKLLAGGRVIGQATTSADGDDDTGRFSFDYVPAGPFRLEAQDPATARTGVATGTIDEEGETVDVDIVAQALGTIDGTAFLNHLPLPNARIRVESGSFRADTLADANGYFVVRGVPEGRVVVSASLDGAYLRGTAEGTLTGEGTTLTINVDLHNAGTLNGTVWTAGRGAVVPRVPVTATASGSGGGHQSVTADGEGRFVFDRLPTGTVTVDVEVPGSIDRGRATVEVPAGDAVEMELQLNGVGALRVHALDSNGDRTAGYVEIKGTGPFPYTVGANVGATGEYVVPELLAGPVTATLRTTVGTFQLYGTATGAIAPGLESTLAVQVQPSGTVFGTVLRSDGLTPAVGATVIASVAGRSGHLSGSTGPDGTFRLTGVPLGTVTVRADDPLTRGVGLVTGLTLAANDDEAPAGIIVLDDTTIEVRSIDPPNDAVGVGPSQLVRLTFSDPIASTAGISVQSGSSTIYAPATISDGGRTVTLQASWPSESLIEVVVSTTLTDIYGRHPAEPFTSRFRTTDSSPPRVLSIVPAHGATQIDPATTIVVAFSEDLSTTGLTSVVSLSGPNGTIAGTSELTGPREITFRPAYLLQGDAHYTVTVNHARDPSGNEQTSATTARFATPDTTAPEIRLSSPSHGSKTTNRRPTISFYVDDPITGIDPASGTMTLTTAAGTQSVTPTVSGSSLRYTPTEDLPLGTIAVAASIADLVGHRSSASGSFTVQIDPIGALTVRLLMPDGFTPAPNSRVRVMIPNWTVVAEGLTNAEGERLFENLDVRGYDVEALNADGRVRAREPVTLIADQTTSVDLVLAPEGRVTGHVRRPGGAAAALVNVSVRSHHPTWGATYSTRTDATGAYTVERFPVGNVTVTVEDTANFQRGEATGVVVAGETAEIDVQLVANAVGLPARLWDGNNYYLDVQRNGTGRASLGNFALEIERDSVVTPFAGAANGSREQNDQEIAIRQSDVAGLDVTRKVFVPRDGYFFRYLELLANPGAADLTVNVRIRTPVDYGQQGALIYDSSSGDAALDVTDPATADRWVVLDDPVDGDSWTNTTALVFDGPGGRDRVDATTWTPSPHWTAPPPLVTYTWQAITIPAGQTVALLHFGLNQMSRASARVAAERLVQLPPEAIDGLSAEEIAAIQNFAVPADGVSQVAALPSLYGTINGRTLAGDGTTIVGGTQVRFRSLHPLYGRVHAVTSHSSTGAFQFTTQITQHGATRVIPVADFVLEATEPRTGVLSPAPVRPFSPPQTSTTADVVFTGTGLVQGTVRWHTGAVAANADVYIHKPTGGTWFFRADGNGRYFATGILPGTLRVDAYGPTGTGPSIPGTTTVTVVAGQLATADVTLIPVGHVSGTLRRADGTPVSGTYVWVTVVNQATGQSWALNANWSTGQYAITNIPTGTYWVQANDPTTNVQAREAVTIVQDETAVRDLTFIGHGTVILQVFRTSGAVAGGVHAYIAEAARGYRRDAGRTDANGYLTITGVSQGNFTIDSYPEWDTRFTGVVSGRIDTHGQTTAVNVTLPPYGRLTGRVTRVTGAPVPSAWVQAYYGDTGNYVADNADGNGIYDIPYVWAEAPVRVYSASGAEVRQVFTSLTDGETKEVNLVLTSLATVRVTVKRADDTPIASTPVAGRDAYGTSFWTQYTDAAGTVTYPNVREGEALFVATAIHARATVNVLPSDHGRTLDVTIIEPPAGTVQGTVNAADGVTPVRNASVRIIDPDTGNQWYSTTTNGTTGTYQIANVRGDKLVVRAVSPIDGNVTVDRPTAITSAGAVETVDVTLPLSVVQGRVYFGDNVTPVPSPTVVVSQTNESTGAIRTYTANWKASDGQYVVLGPTVGAFTVTAQDPVSTLLGQASGTVVQIETPVALDVQLQHSGTVTGIVRNAQGQATPGVQVAVGMSGLGATRTVYTDGSGRYTLTRVALGTLLLQARSGDTIGGAIAALAAHDEVATADIVLSGLGTVRGIVLAEDGVTPVVGATVHVYPNGPHGPLNWPWRSVTTNQSGQYQANSLPIGSVRVVATSGGTAWRAGVVDSVLVAPGPLDAPPIVLGNAWWLSSRNEPLMDAGGYRYDVTCWGGLYDGTTDAYDDAWKLFVSGVPFQCATGARSADAGRTVGLGPFSFSGVRVARDVFVPADGGFARFLESFTNDTASPVTIDVRIEANLGSDGDTRTIVTPESTGGTYAVTDNGTDGPGKPSIGHVFAGTGAAALPVVTFTSPSDQVTYRWQLTIPAGATVSLIHFQAQRQLRLDAQTQAASLAALTDPLALTGLSPAQRASIVNFIVP